MNELVYAYFISRFRSLRPVGDEGWYSFNDPFGQKKDGSFRVNFDYHTVMDWRSEYKSSTTEFIQYCEGLKSLAEVLSFLGLSYTPMPIPLKPTKVRPEVSDLPEGLTLDAPVTDKVFTRGVKYLLGRGFSMEFLLERELRVVTEGRYANRVLIPFIEGSKCVYFTARDYTGLQSPKYKNPANGETICTHSEVVYNSQALEQEKCYLVEGVFCAWTLMQDGLPAIATDGWILNAKKREILLKSKAKEIVAFADKGFYAHTCRQLAFLRVHKKVKVVSLDALGEEGKDINDIGTARALALEAQAHYLTLRDCL